MNRETANVLLLLVGGALLKVCLDGSYVRYVRPSFLPILVVGAVVILVLAVSAVVRDVRRGRAEESVDGHGHAHGTRSYWLLLVPAAVVLFVAPPALGASSVGISSMQSGPTQSGSPRMTAFAPLPPGPAPEVSLREVVQRAVTDSTGSLDDRVISTVGFVVPTADGGSAGGAPGGLDLARILIVCCAADARTVRIHLDGDLTGSSESLPTGTWLKVTGVVDTGSATAANGYTPTFRMSSAQQIPEPENTYAY